MSVIPFGHTDFTLRRRIERTCREDEREMMRRAAWMLQFSSLEPRPCETEDDWKAFEDGSYEW